MRYRQKILIPRALALYSTLVLLAPFLAYSIHAYGVEFDLEVINIERNPKYESHQGGMVRYMNAEYLDDFTPYEVDSAIGLLNPDAQHWPAEGEEVTFTAHVRNRGTSPVTAFQWTWRIDGVPVLSGSYEGALQPGSETTLNYVWSWSSERHTVGFEASLAGDATPANNQVTDFTDALSFFALIEEGFDEKFRLNTPQVAHPKAAYMTEWLQHHIRRFNEMFEEANAPTRVRYDRLEIVADGSHPGGCAPECQRWDGAFPAVWYASTLDPRLDANSYYNQSVEDIDYGLLHELGHQLGLVDLYRINMAKENNKVNGWPYQKPYPSAPIGLMHGVTPIISSHTAGALTRWHGFRRGYFGQYLYDIPAHNSLLIKDACENPLVGANVEVYQKVGRVGGWEEVPNQAKFSGTTDANGLYELPNVEIDPTNFPEIETGNVLRPNPFGYISNHAENGLFLIKMFTTAEPSWKFIDITKFNEAYWSGETQASTYEIQTALVRNPIPGNQALDQPASANFDAYWGWCAHDPNAPPDIPQHAVDGDLETAWCRTRIEPGAYWQVDLGRKMWIYRVDLVSNYIGYRVEGSLTDAFAGEQKLMYRETDGLFVHDNTAPPRTYGFPPVLARYVRLTTEITQDHNTLHEIRMFAAQGSCGTVFASGFESGESRTE